METGLCGRRRDRERAGYFVVFFFQAEDGIRDADVTGVQTCALPIYPWKRLEAHGVKVEWLSVLDPLEKIDAACRGARLMSIRSEERRVGKECRYRWSPYQ